MRRSPRLLLLALTALVLATVPAVPKDLPREPPLDARATTEPSWGDAALLNEPIELSVTEELRAQCPELVLPEPFVLDPEGTDFGALEGLVQCVTTGPLRGYEIEIFGLSELPRRISAPMDGSEPADLVRSILGGLGVPLSQMVTVDLDVDPMTSLHGAPRVVVGLLNPEAP